MKNKKLEITSLRAKSGVKMRHLIVTEIRPVAYLQEILCGINYGINGISIGKKAYCEFAHAHLLV